MIVFPTVISRGWLADLAAQSCPTLATPWTVACQAPLSVGFSRQEYWSGLPRPLPGDLDLRIEPASPASPALADRFFTSEPPGKLCNTTNPPRKRKNQGKFVLHNLLFTKTLVYKKPPFLKGNVISDFKAQMLK